MMLKIRILYTLLQSLMNKFRQKFRLTVWMDEMIAINVDGTIVIAMYNVCRM